MAPPADSEKLSIDAEAPQGQPAALTPTGTAPSVKEALGAVAAQATSEPQQLVDQSAAGRSQRGSRISLGSYREVPRAAQAPLRPGSHVQAPDSQETIDATPKLESKNFTPTGLNVSRATALKWAAKTPPEPTKLDPGTSAEAPGQSSARVQLRATGAAERIRPRPSLGTAPASPAPPPQAASSQGVRLAPQFAVQGLANPVQTDGSATPASLAEPETPRGRVAVAIAVDSLASTGSQTSGRSTPPDVSGVGPRGGSAASYATSLGAPTPENNQTNSNNAAEFSAQEGAHNEVEQAGLSASVGFPEAGTISYNYQGKPSIGRGKPSFSAKGIGGPGDPVRAYGEARANAAAAKANFAKASAAYKGNSAIRKARAQAAFDLQAATAAKAAQAKKGLSAAQQAAAKKYANRKAPKSSRRAARLKRAAARRVNANERVEQRMRSRTKAWREYDAKRKLEQAKKRAARRDRNTDRRLRRTGDTQALSVWKTAVKELKEAEKAIKAADADLKAAEQARKKATTQKEREAATDAKDKATAAKEAAQKKAKEATADKEWATNKGFSAKEIDCCDPAYKKCRPPCPPGTTCECREPADGCPKKKEDEKPGEKKEPDRGGEGEAPSGQRRTVAQRKTETEPPQDESGGGPPPPNAPPASPPPQPEPAPKPKPEVGGTPYRATVVADGTTTTVDDDDTAEPPGVQFDVYHPPPKRFIPAPLMKPAEIKRAAKEEDAPEELVLYLALLIRLLEELKKDPRDDAKIGVLALQLNEVSLKILGDVGSMAGTVVGDMVKSTMTLIATLGGLAVALGEKQREILRDAAKAGLRGIAKQLKKWGWLKGIGHGLDVSANAIDIAAALENYAKKKLIDEFLHRLETHSSLTGLEVERFVKDLAMVAVKAASDPEKAIRDLLKELPLTRKQQKAIIDDFGTLVEGALEGDAASAALLTAFIVGMVLTGGRMAKSLKKAAAAVRKSTKAIKAKVKRKWRRTVSRKSKRTVTNDGGGPNAARPSDAPNTEGGTPKPDKAPQTPDDADVDVGRGWRSGDPLPDTDRAWDIRERFDEYLLDPSKSGGKSRIFESYGFKKGDGAGLERQIRDQLPNKSARLAPKAQQGDPAWGTKYYVDLEVQTPSRRPMKMTAVFRMEADGPQMVNALPYGMVK